MTAPLTITSVTLRRFSTATALLALAAAPALADHYLMYGPSLAVWLQATGATAVSTPHVDHAGAPFGGVGVFLVDESDLAEDAGHLVTIVDEGEWRAMSTADFAAFDALVIGDAGCDFDGGDLLEPIRETRTIWSPAVTGHLFLHTFDNMYHLNQNSPGGSTLPEHFQAMEDLAVKGMEFAASGGSTGLYYANGCRSFAATLHPPALPEGEGGEELRPLEFLSRLVTLDVSLGDEDGNVVQIVAAAHPVMSLMTDAALSEWSNSYHAQFEGVGGPLEVLAIDPVADGGAATQNTIIVATGFPLGPHPPIFGDGFESGSAGQWSAVVDGEPLSSF